MEAVGLNLVVLIAAVLTATASTQANGVCNSCNCEFNNVQVLDQLVNARIANTIGKFNCFSNSKSAYCRYNNNIML